MSCVLKNKCVSCLVDFIFILNVYLKTKHNYTFVYIYVLKCKNLTEFQIALKCNCIFNPFECCVYLFLRLIISEPIYKIHTPRFQAETPCQACFMKLNFKEFKLYSNIIFIAYA